MQLYIRRTGTLNLHYLVVEKCVIKILSFFLVVEMHSKDLYLLSVLLLVMAGVMYATKFVQYLFIFQTYFNIHTKKKLFKDMGKKKNEITSCGPQFDF